MRGLAATGGIVATGVGANRLDLTPARRAEALAPVVVLGGAAIGAGLAWGLREFDVLGNDAPADGLTASALDQMSYETALTRESTNASTIVDNQTILDGIQDNAYIEGKLAAFDAINNEKSQSDVQADATAAVDAYETTVTKNFLKTWNESVAELGTIGTRYNDHPDKTDYSSGNSDMSAVFDHTFTPDNEPQVHYNSNVQGGPYSYTLPDGTTMDLNAVYQQMFYDDYVEYTPVNVESIDTSQYSGGEFTKKAVRVEYDGDNFDYLDKGVWGPFLTEIGNTFQTVRDGLSLWVDSVYGQVQSGEIAVDELLTPREQASMKTDDGKYPQAVADLLALNVPVDFEREAVVSLDYHEDDITLRGSLGITQPPSTMEPGQYDPAADNLGSVFLTYDVGKGEGVWTAYDTTKGVDGGTVEFEKEPYTGVTYEISTNYNETATVTASDFTEGTDGSSNTVWTADVSDQLDNSIAEISEIIFYTETDETRYETIQLDGIFTIEKFVNKETGEEESSANFESKDPQTDSNYVTQEEWDQLQEQNQRLIQMYEESQDSSGGGGSSSSGFLSGEWMGIPKAGVLLGGAGVSLLGYELFSDDDDDRRGGGGRY